MKRLVKIMVVVSLLVASSGMAAKDKAEKKADQKISGPVLATTDDGRRVVLMPDHTWQFVEGRAAPAGNSCRDAMWEDLVSYFQDWGLKTINKDSYLLKTEWHRIQLGTFVENQVRVTCRINKDCDLDYTIDYRDCDPDTGCHDMDYGPDQEWSFKTKAIKEGIKFDRGLRADLDRIEKKADE